MVEAYQHAEHCGMIACAECEPKQEKPGKQLATSGIRTCEDRLVCDYCLETIEA